MLNALRVTDALPGELAVAPLTPADVVDVSYSPALLLPAPFAASLVADEEFQRACQAGFETYFEDMYQEDGAGGLVFVERFYNLEEVKAFVSENVLPDRACWGLPAYWQSSLAWRAGFVLGWLSALALTDRAAALAGLRLAVGLIEAQWFARKRKK